MTAKSGQQPLIGRLLRDRGGNFALMTAIVLPVILAAGGVAIDLSRIVMTRANLQDAADSATLAAASALANDGKTQAEAKLLAMQFLKTQLSDSDGIATDAASQSEIDTGTVITITETALLGNGKSYKVDLSTKHTTKFTAFTQLLGQNSTELRAKSTAEAATESKSALSMFLVLDKSGSMAWITNEKDPDTLSCVNWTEANWGRRVSATSPCYISKMAALKLAVASLFTQFTKADPTGTFVRTGAIAYDLSSYSPSELAWGSAAALNYVNLLNAEGGTASGASMKTAYNRLKASTEDMVHKTKNGQVPTKYIVFMTDGANNYSSDDTSTLATCTSAKTDAIEIYTVAFMAPTAGQTLLKSCATDSSHYFQAENMASLVAAFKVIGERTSSVIARVTQ